MLFKGSFEEFKKSVQRSDLTVKEELFNPLGDRTVTFFNKLRCAVIVDGSRYELKVFPRFDHYGNDGLGSFEWRQCISNKHPKRKIIEKNFGDFDHFCGGDCASVDEAKEMFEKYIVEALSKS